jgi:electron transport complex protein RnfC
VGEGKLPSDVGVVVDNVTTTAKLARYLRDGVPLIAKRVTIDGGAVKEPKNVNVLIGTPIIKVLEFCGGFKAEPKKLIMGGPMMGTAVYDENYPIIKNNNAILAFDEKQVEEYAETDCIRCGRCVMACPYNLMPLRIEDAFNKDDNEALEKYKVNLCMECGCCAYACPAKRHLVQVHRLAKARLRAAQANKKKGA